MSSIALAADHAACLRSSVVLGNAATQSPGAGRNALLAALGESAAQIKGQSRQVKFGPRVTLDALNMRSDVVLFPESGLIAIQCLGVDGALSEVGTVGTDGAVGLFDALSGAPDPFTHFTLSPTTVWITPAEVVERVFRDDPAAAKALWRYLAQTQTWARQDIACATRHRGLERLADRLLAYSRELGARLPVTQDDLAQALGMTRTSITALVTTLSNAGLTRTGRGWIEILAADRLADLACGCRRAHGLREGATAF